ncbi:Conserved hypothetical protein [gamma proteobacterium HdN1]|nr:Conserved hypothetical protein [gamma proteobacterium HdN1]
MIAPDVSLTVPFRLLLDEVGAFVYTTDLKGRYTYANRLVCELLGQPLEALIGYDFSHFVDIGEEGVLREADRQVIEEGITIEQEESNLIHATGEMRHYWSVKKPLRDASGNILGLLGISYDISEKKRLEDQVREQKSLLDTVLDNVDALVYMKDAEHRFVYTNRKMAAVLGHSQQDIAGHMDEEFVPPEQLSQFREIDDRTIVSGERYTGEHIYPSAHEGERFYWSVVVPWMDVRGGRKLIGVSTDITELHDLRIELERQSRTDHLTGVGNRRSFYENAQREFARSRRHNTLLSFITFDIDHFKQINDIYGHSAGDEVLHGLADVCLAALRREDTLVRTGGEEFGVLLPDTDIVSAFALAERIRVLVKQALLGPKDSGLQVSVSLGVAMLSQEDTSFDTLYLRADRALYEAKRGGRDRSVMANMRRPATDRRS